MPLSFKFAKERIVLDYRVFLFEEFINIWKLDRSKTKDKANAFFYFIFLLCDINSSNPLRDVDSDKREAEAKYRAFGDKNKKFTSKEYDLLDKAISIYKKLNLTPEERLLEAFDEKAEELSDMLEGETPETVKNEVDGVVSFVSNSKLITTGLTKLSEIRENRAAIVASIKNEAMSEKVRGQVALSPLDRGLLQIE